MCFGCSKEPSHRDGSFEYPQHMFWLRNKEIFFGRHSYLKACNYISVENKKGRLRRTDEESLDKWWRSIIVDFLIAVVCTCRQSIIILATDKKG